jgi:hypothetical protein
VEWGSIFAFLSQNYRPSKKGISKYGMANALIVKTELELYEKSIPYKCCGSGSGMEKNPELG